MKPDELMIGDWVYNTFHKENICITPYDFFVHGHDEYGDQYLNCSCKPCLGRDLEPIPLTEEFFEKNGFKKVDYDYLEPNLLFESDDKRIQITDVNNSGDGYWYVHVDNEDYDTIGRCDVKYVHQFQQLLRLCGYEMDVVM
jgi:hypothetical protein